MITGTTITTNNNGSYNYNLFSCHYCDFIIIIIHYSSLLLVVVVLIVVVVVVVVKCDLKKLWTINKPWLVPGIDLKNKNLF